MEKDTNEKSLMVVQDSFLTKVKNFFSRFFFGKDEEIEEEKEPENENKYKIVKPDIVPDLEEEESEEEKEWKLYNFDADNPEEWPEPKDIPVSEDDDEDYEKETISEVCREKEELEQKLKNYYASITNMNS